MVDIDQNFQTTFDREMRFVALDICNKADAARVMFVVWIIQALPWREAHFPSLFFDNIFVIKMLLDGILRILKISFAGYGKEILRPPRGLQCLAWPLGQNRKCFQGHSAVNRRHKYCKSSG